MIFLRGGTYFLSEPLALGPEDSGSNGSPIIWSAYLDEKPILSGGRRISTWQKTTINGHEAWMADLPAAEGSWTPRELWVDGRPMLRSRWPKRRTFAVAKRTGPPTTRPWQQPVDEFQFDGQDLRAWPDAGEAEVVVMSRWVESRLPIASIDESNHTVHFAKKSVFDIDPADRYWVENVEEALTEPGEFYVDAKEKKIYLIPPLGVFPESAQVIVPSLVQVMQLHGNPAGGKPVEHITFRGLTFANSEWYHDRAVPTPRDATGGTFGNKPDPSRTGFHQAAIGVPGAVWGEGVRDCIFDHCTITNIGSYGIELASGCQHNLITHCTIDHTGAGGIKIGETAARDEPALQTFDNEVSDCTIADGGNLFPSCVALWIGQSHDNRIIHNDIHDFWYTAISMGWTWGYGKSAAQRNLVEWNHIHHIGIKSNQEAPILSDLGGIYTLGNQEGGIIRFNEFHDMAATKYGGWGIYFDEGTTHLTAEDNLVYRTTHGAFHQHYGNENVVRNNIFALGRDAQIQRTRVEEHLSFSFERNIIYWDRGNLLAGNWSKENAAFDHNTYWRAGGGEIRFGKKTWEQWREAGMDVHSTIADPKFTDPRNGNFSIGAKESLPEGFVPFDFSGVGPRS